MGPVSDIINHFTSLKMQAHGAANEAVGQNLQALFKALNTGERLAVRAAVKRSSMAAEDDEDDWEAPRRANTRLKSAPPQQVSFVRVTWEAGRVGMVTMGLGGGGHVAWLARANSGLLQLASTARRHHSCVFLAYATALLPHLPPDHPAVNALAAVILDQAQAEARSIMAHLVTRLQAGGTAFTGAQAALWLVLHHILAPDHPINPLFPCLLSIPALDGRAILVVRCKVGESNVARVDVMGAGAESSHPPVYVVADEGALHAQALLPVGASAEAFCRTLQQHGVATFAGGCSSAMLCLVGRQSWAAMCEPSFVGHTRFLADYQPSGCAHCGAALFSS